MSEASGIIVITDDEGESMPGRMTKSQIADLQRVQRRLSARGRTLHEAEVQDVLSVIVATRIRVLLTALALALTLIAALGALAVSGPPADAVRLPGLLSVFLTVFVVGLFAYAATWGLSRVLAVEEAVMHVELGAREDARVLAGLSPRRRRAAARFLASATPPWRPPGAS